MWRNVSWNSTDSSLPEGMHKHETGAYFKTAAPDSAPASCRPASPGALEEEPVEEAPSREPAPRQQSAGSERQQRKLRETQRNSSNSSASTAATSRPMSSAAQPANFRARLSSISDALHHPPRLAKRLFTGAHHQQHQQEESQAPVQITTTSIDSPQHLGAPGAGQLDGHPLQEHARPMLSSGRRLSQLFLPQLGAHAPVDPFGQAPDLFPAHLLGLYGQPPLVGGGVGPSLGAGGPRASWADISLLGRPANVRPSIDSAFHGPSAGQMRHSFDARK